MFESEITEANCATRTVDPVPKTHRRSVNVDVCPPVAVVISRERYVTRQPESYWVESLIVGAAPVPVAGVLPVNRKIGAPVAIKIGGNGNVVV